MSRTYEIFRGARGLWLAPVAALAVLAALPACAQAGGQSQGGAAQGSEVVGVVDGQNVTMSELEEHASDQLDQVEAALQQCQHQVQQNRFQVLDNALHDLAHERMVAAAAAKAGQSSEDYLAAELESKVPPVTDEQIDKFYTDNQARMGNRTKEQVAPQIRQYLEQQARQEIETKFYGDLESKYEAVYRLEPPRTEVAAEGPAKGPDNAPVTIVEFSDFQCPFCGRVVPTLRQVEKNYGDKVRLVFRQFPLSIHENAQKAAEASLCAREQGKFWEMHDAMFDDQQNLAVANLKAKAQTIGLDGEKFDQCLDSGQYADEVAADMKAGVAAGVNGTPAMFINGIPISGAVPYENIAEQIDAELQRKGVDTGSGASSK